MRCLGLRSRGSRRARESRAMIARAVLTSAAPARRPRHRPVPFTAVEIQDRLWSGRQRVVLERTVPFLYAQREKIGMIEALDVTAPPGPLAFPYKNNGTSTTVMYWDSDIAKWIETASYLLAARADPKLDARIDDVIARITKAQQPDGYFNSFFQRRGAAKQHA